MLDKWKPKKGLKFTSKGAYYAFFALMVLACLVLARIVSWALGMALGW